MIRRFLSLALASVIWTTGGSVFAQNPQQPATPPPPLNPAQQTAPPARADERNPTAEQIAATVLYVYSPRIPLAQIRRTGTERGRVARTHEDGRTEEVNYERHFMRGESSDKDKIRWEQRTPSGEYALVYGEGRVWGVTNETHFTPRQDAANEFLTSIRQDIDALLRYRENGSTIALAGRDRQQGIDFWMLDLTDKEGQRTRYFISARTWRVLSLEYEATPTGGSAPVRYRKTFHDYRYAQGTLVPYRTVLYANGQVAQESRILTITYGVRLEEAIFRHPDSPAPASATRN